MSLIDTSRALAQFDELVLQKELFYSHSNPSIISEDGLEFDIRAVPAFSHKPKPASKDNPNETAKSSTRPPPTDSDIDHMDPLFFVSSALDHHKLILNKFCVFRPQYLLLTVDPTHKQTEPLVEQDIIAAWATLRELDNNDSDGNGKKQGHYMIYNGSPAGGSSRKHKHMQLFALPKPEDGDLELLPYREGQLEKLPIKAFFAHLDRKSLENMAVEEAGRAVSGIVSKQWRACRDALRKSEGDQAVDAPEETAKDEELVPHNVMMTREWVVTVPRSKATVEGRLEGHVVGCQGVLGSVWCAKEEQVEAWRKVGLKDVLRELGVKGKMEYC